MDTYSQVADQQLVEEELRDSNLSDAVLTVCEHILDHPQQTQSMSRAIRTRQGIRMLLSVPGFPLYRVFWSTELPRAEAVFPCSFDSR